MKKKQWVGLVIAAVIFVAVGSISVLVNSAVNRSISEAGSMFDSFMGKAIELPSDPYLGVVSIEGTIGDYPNYDTGELIEGSPIYYIEMYRDDPNNKGIMLYIDSPGGSVYETDEIYLALEEYKKSTGRPVYAWGGSYVASGAYYIAAAADELVINRNCWVGSIGVYIQVTNVAGLLDKLGVENEYIKTGDSKAMGSLYEHLTDDQRAIYQGLVDDSYETFLSVVMKGRGYTRDELVPLADGRVYTANQALANGLIDGIGDYASARDAAIEDCGAEIAYLPADSVSDWFSSFIGLIKGDTNKSDTQAALEYIEGLGSLELMYYAG